MSTNGNVIKRNGLEVKYNFDKVVNAIMAAAMSVDVTIDAKFLDKLKTKLNKILKTKDLCVYNIQEITENTLMDSKYKNVARAYIEYRQQSDNIREQGGELFQEVNNFVSGNNDEWSRENANKDAAVVNTHRDMVTGLLSKHMAIKHILPKNIAKAHTDGYTHIHDLDYFISPLTNCMLVNYTDMMENGFKLGDAHVETPKSIGVASTVLSQIAQAVASAQYGGQSFAEIDYGLEPYVKASHIKILKIINKRVELANKKLHKLGKLSQDITLDANDLGMGTDYVDELLCKEVYDAMQTFLYQINTLSTTNGQTPFVTISFGMNTSYYGRMIIEQYLKNHIRGLGKRGKTPIFPKVVHFLEEGVNMNPRDPNYDLKLLSIECSTKRMYPDYISAPLNRIITGCKKSVTTPMGCRSFLRVYIDPITGKEKTDGRFNLGVVSVNLALMAADALNQIDNIASISESKIAELRKSTFRGILNKYLEIAYDTHMVRINRLKGTKAGVNPVLFCEGAVARLDREDTIDQLFYNGYASISIGFIGVSEAAEFILGHQDKEFAIEICQFMKDKCTKFEERSGLAFGLYGTPSESYCKKAAAAVHKKYPNLIERDYVTNSFHQPVWVESTPIQKWKYEEGFANICSGGNIGYVEAPSLVRNPKGYEALVDFAYKHIQYFAVNTPIDECYECGFTGELTPEMDGYHCPQCGNHNPYTISATRRVSGYLGDASRPFNIGKQQEVTQRVKHVVNLLDTLRP